MFKRIQGAALVAPLLLGLGTAQAAVFTYTDPAQYAIDLGGFTFTTEDFEGYTLGTTFASGATLGPFTYIDAGATGLDFVIHADADTSSGTQGLGLDDGGWGLMTELDSITISFAATQAFGISLLVEPGAFDDDLVLDGAGSSVGLFTTDLVATLGDGTEQYFLGLYDDSGSFTSVTLSASGAGTWSWHVDDVMVQTGVAAPEPGQGLGALLGVWALAAVARRRRGV